MYIHVNIHIWRSKPAPQHRSISAILCMSPVNAPFIFVRGTADLLHVGLKAPQCLSRYPRCLLVVPAGLPCRGPETLTPTGVTRSGRGGGRWSLGLSLG